MYSLQQNIMQNPILTAASKLVFAVISEHCCNSTEGISYDVISNKTSLVKMTVIRCVKQLEAEGFISITKNPRGWNIYELM